MNNMKVDLATANGEFLLPSLSKQGPNKAFYAQESKNPHSYILTDQEPSGLVQGLYNKAMNYLNCGFGKLNDLEKIAELFQKRVNREFDKSEKWGIKTSLLNYETIVANLNSHQKKLIKDAKAIGKEYPKNEKLQAAVKGSIDKINEVFNQTIFRVHLQHLISLRVNTPSNLEGLMKGSGAFSRLLQKENPLETAAQELTEINKALEFVKLGHPLYEELMNYREILNLFLGENGNSLKLENHAHTFLNYLAWHHVNIPQSPNKETRSEEIQKAIDLLNAKPLKTAHDLFSIANLRGLKTLYDAISLADNYNKTKYLEITNKLAHTLPPELANKLANKLNPPAAPASKKEKLAKGVVRYAILRGGAHVPALSNAVSYIAPAVQEFLPFIQDHPVTTGVIELGLFTLCACPWLVTTPLAWVDDKVTGGRVRRHLPGFVTGLFS